MTMLQYDFTEEEKAKMIKVAEHESIEEMLKLSGKTVFTLDEAIYITQRMAEYDWDLARRIESHPIVQEYINNKRKPKP